MSVYIPGMEMPKSCYFCEMYEAELYWCSAAKRDIDSFDDYDSRSSFCPLVPVPEHGRLMDKDAFIDGCKALSSNDPHDIAGMEIIKFFMEEIVPTPTIIPADPVKEEQT